MKYRKKDGKIVKMPPFTDREQVEDAIFFFCCLLNYHVRATKLGYVSVAPNSETERWFSAGMTSREMSQDRYANALVIGIDLCERFLKETPEEEILDAGTLTADQLEEKINSVCSLPKHFHSDRRFECQLDPEQL